MYSIESLQARRVNVRFPVLVAALLVLSGPLFASVSEITGTVSGEDRERISAAAPAGAPAKPASERKILVFSLTKGFRHSSIPHGVFAMDAIGKKSGAFSIEHSEDPSVFAADNLRRFDAVMMLNTTGELFTDAELQNSLADFVKGGKGLIGIHSASDTFYSWEEYGKMMGGYFDGHPWHETVKLKVEDPEHATCACFHGNDFEVIDEIYQYREDPYSRERLRVLLSLDPSGTDMKKDGMKRADGDYAVGWVQRYGAGRVFYCNLGHREDTYWNPTVLQHYLAGIQFALGDLEADTTPSAAVARNRAIPDAPVLKKGDRLAIVGDSITEQKLYSKYIETYLLACMPELEVQSCQFGWGGERAPGFAGRMENDLVPWGADVVTTCFGMNDGSYRAYEDGIGAAYEDGMRRIIDRMKAAGAVIVVGSPGVVDSETFAKDRPEFDRVYNENLSRLRDIAGKLAAENGLPFANVFDAMMAAMTGAKAAFGDNYHVGGGDGVHPAPNGHLVMAYAFLRGLGLNGDLGRIAVDWENGEAEGSGGHRVAGFAGGKVTAVSAKYPFCFPGDGNGPDATRSILSHVPFNQDLNRMLLVVNHLPAPQAEVTWGASSKTFTREQLAAGVNLAAEFPDNPFSEPFARVLAAVGEKQGFETPMIKELITGFRAYERFTPEDEDIRAATGIIRRRLFARNDALHAAAKAAVVPVQHEIVIVPK